MARIWRILHLFLEDASGTLNKATEHGERAEKIKKLGLLILFTIGWKEDRIVSWLGLVAGQIPSWVSEYSGYALFAFLVWWAKSLWDRSKPVMVSVDVEQDRGKQQFDLKIRSDVDYLLESHVFIQSAVVVRDRVPEKVIKEAFELSWRQNPNSNRVYVSHAFPRYAAFLRLEKPDIPDETFSLVIDGVTGEFVIWLHKKDVMEFRIVAIVGNNGKPKTSNLVVMPDDKNAMGLIVKPMPKWFFQKSYAPAQA